LDPRQPTLEITDETTALTTAGVETAEAIAEAVPVPVPAGSDGAIAETGTAGEGGPEAGAGGPEAAPDPDRLRESDVMI
jgi:hypothetical protein